MPINRSRSIAATLSGLLLGGCADCSSPQCPTQRQLREAFYEREAEDGSAIQQTLLKANPGSIVLVEPRRRGDLRRLYCRPQVGSDEVICHYSQGERLNATVQLRQVDGQWQLAR
jgi:hypothetical protein